MCHAVYDFQDESDANFDLGEMRKVIRDSINGECTLHEYLLSKSRAYRNHNASCNIVLAETNMHKIRRAHWNRLIKNLKSEGK